MACGRPSRRRRSGDGVGVVPCCPPRAARRAQMPARAAGRSEASRDTSPAVRAWLLRPDQEALRACILSKVPVPWYRYLAAQRGRAALVKARGSVARFSSECAACPSPPRPRAAAGSPATDDLRDGSSQASSSLERSGSGRPRVPRNVKDRQERPQFGTGREAVGEIGVPQNAESISYREAVGSY